MLRSSRGAQVLKIWRPLDGQTGSDAGTGVGAVGPHADNFFEKRGFEDAAVVAGFRRSAGYSVGRAAESRGARTIRISNRPCRSRRRLPKPHRGAHPKSRWSPRHPIHILEYAPLVRLSVQVPADQEQVPAPSRCRGRGAS